LKATASGRANIEVEQNKMTEEVDPIKALISARDKLVEERRALTVAIALGYRRRRTDDIHANEMRETFIELQKLIEAIGRAIEHEKMIEAEHPDPIMPPIESNKFVA
jgi:lysyl-tRNA synthetase class II